MIFFHLKYIRMKYLCSGSLYKHTPNMEERVTFILQPRADHVFKAIELCKYSNGLKVS